MNLPRGPGGAFRLWGRTELARDDRVQGSGAKSKRLVARQALRSPPSRCELYAYIKQAFN